MRNEVYFLTSSEIKMGTWRPFFHYDRMKRTYFVHVSPLKALMLFSSLEMLFVLYVNEMFRATELILQILKLLYTVIIQYVMHESLWRPIEFHCTYTAVPVYRTNSIKITKCFIWHTDRLHILIILKLIVQYFYFVYALAPGHNVIV